MRIRDHRHTKRAITWDPSIKALHVDRDRSLLEHRLTVVTRALRRTEFQRRVLIPAAVIVVGFLIFFVTGMTQRRAKSTDEYIPAGVLIVGLVLASLLVLFSTGRSARRLWRYFSRDCGAAGLCPSCGYGLTDAPVEDDGCRVCPECGGAWLAQA